MKSSNSKKIILASSSLRRKRILEQLGLSFSIDPSGVEEVFQENRDPKNQVQYFSKQKAKAVAKRYKNAIIIAADTVVLFKNKILGKPLTKTKALQMLQELSGESHTVLTGLTVLDTDSQKSITTTEKTKVYMRNLSKDEIKNYVKTKEPLDKAGAYGIQEKGALLIEKIEGDFYNVVGLPINKLVESLKKFNIPYL